MMKEKGEYRESERKEKKRKEGIKKVSWVGTSELEE